MIDYKASRLFSSVANDCDILDHITDITVDAYGGIKSADTGISVILEYIAVENGSVSFNLSVIIPILSINSEGITVTPNTLSVSNNLSILVSSDPYINTFSDGVYQVGGVLKLNKIRIHPSRAISICGSDPIRGVELYDGYNVKVEYRDGIVYITGGAGLGKGQYDGRYSELVSHTYSGIKSINGLRSDRNINITMSDLLLANGALVRTGYDKKDQTGNTE